MTFANLAATLRLDISNFSASLSRASRQMNSFASNMYTSYGVAAKELNKHNLGLKDTVRIVHGIVVAQTFYKAANAIADATSALWNFNVALDYMHVTYSALFGDTKVASDFMAVLQEHSVETIFDYQNLADASKKLLAYGIEYENLMFIMEGLTNLGAMSGDSAALDRIALALGQIYTKGKLSAEEMRQLANAYIPITEILQDKFGLTGDDLKRVGDLNLPASDVINAIVDYANENFGSVGDAAMYTITGLQNKIVDTLKVVGAEMLKPVTTAYKSFLAYVADGLEVLRTEFEAGGIGGIFEYLVPDPNAQATIRQFVANVRNLFMSLASVGTVIGQVFGNAISVLVTAFNVVSPVITGLVNVLAGLLNAMLSTREGMILLRTATLIAATAFVILKVQAMAALVVTAVTKAIVGLSKALLILGSIIVKHPILSLLAALAVTLIGVSTASNGANKAISGLFDTLSGAVGGSSSNDFLQKTEQDIIDSSEAADQFNNRLEGAADSADDLADAIGGAGSAADKAAKKTGGLLSFDEVFKLPEKSDPKGSGSGSGSGAGGVLEDLENLMGAFNGFGDSLIPDIPDFSQYIKDFTDGLFGGLETGIFDALKSTSIGALIGSGIGAILGGLLGGPAGAVLGAKIGALAGGLVGLLWEKFSGALSNTGVGVLAGIGAAIAKAFGGSFFEVLKQAFTNPGSLAGLFKNIGAIFTGTGLKEILKGGVIGAAIGLVVDSIAHLLWTTLENEFENADAETAKVGQVIGSVIGAIIGGILGGPPGAIIGSAIGTFAGGFVGLFWEPIAEYFDPATNPLSAFFVDVGLQIADWAVNTLTDLQGWWDDTYTGFSNWWGDTYPGFMTWWDDTYSGFTTWWDDTTSGLSSWWEDTVATFTDWDAITGDTLSNWWEETSTGFSEWFEDTFSDFTTWFEDTFSGFITWFADTKSSLSTWATDTAAQYHSWVEDTTATVQRWHDDLDEILFGWVDDAKKAIADWAADTLQSFLDWAADTYAQFEDFKKDAEEVFIGILIAISKAFTDGFEDIGESISDFFSLDNLWNLIKGGIDSFTKKLSKWWEGIGDVFSGDINATPSVNLSASARGSGGGRVALAGHASGGVFNREHVARFAEKNKAEAVIPLEEDRAMKPFVDAVSNGIVSSLAPIVATVNAGNANNLPPMYVGTLIADDRGIEQLYKRFEVIRIQEAARRGTH